MKTFSLFVILFLSIGLFSQDTLTVLQYNLLYYGEATNWCDNGNNNINEKDEYLKTILAYADPDIFTVNEISKSESIHQHLLDKVLNNGETDKYEKANFLQEAESGIVNMLYFNTEKLALHSHFIAQNYIRDIDVYKLYHLSGNLIEGDTNFVICVVAHLKSSDGSTNEEKRRVMASNTMNWLNNYDENANYMMMGDFNIYSPTETAYQEFLNYENPLLRFVDPLDEYGEWHNNEQYSHVHTQSTHSSSNGCAASGGMDDRFDFILISENIRQGLKNIKYVENTYWAVGQDGNRFNQSLVSSPTNTSVPEDVLNALYNMSDHLPVTLELIVENELTNEQNIFAGIDNFTMSNPVQDVLTIHLEAHKSHELTIEIFDMTGQLLLQKKELLVNGKRQLSIPVDTFIPGIYLVKFSDKRNASLTRKMIKY